MSLYWRWVVLTTAVAAIARAVDTLADVTVTWTHGPDQLLWVPMVVLALTTLPIILTQHYVLTSRFPALSRPLYVTMSFLPVVVFAVCFIAMDASGAINDLTASSTDDGTSGETEPSTASIMIVMGLSLLALVALLGCILLPWVAVGQVARGFLLWAFAITAATIANLGFDYAVVSLRGLEWPEATSDTWLGTGRAYLTLVGSELTYALISGIGVASLRPKPEATP